ncbi:MAG: SPOR domain-containing protein [Ferruginibacter sp.]
MKKIVSIIFILIGPFGLFAQNSVIDTAVLAKVTVNKDPRLDILAKAEAEINIRAGRFVKGFRLFVLKSNDRDYALKVRAYLLQNYPDEGIYMSYQSPFIKLRFGNFEDKKDAEKVRDEIMRSGVITGGVYVIADTIELKPDKSKDQEF